MKHIRVLKLSLEFWLFSEIIDEILFLELAVILKNATLVPQKRGIDGRRRKPSVEEVRDSFIIQVLVRDMAYMH